MRIRFLTFVAAFHPPTLRVLLAGTLRVLLAGTLPHNPLIYYCINFALPRYPHLYPLRRFQLLSPKTGNPDPVHLCTLLKTISCLRYLFEYCTRLFTNQLHTPSSLYLPSTALKHPALLP